MKKAAKKVAKSVMKVILIGIGLVAAFYLLVLITAWI